MTYMVFLCYFKFFGEDYNCYQCIGLHAFLHKFVIWYSNVLTSLISSKKNSFIQKADATYNRSSLRIFLHCFQSKHAFLSKDV